MEQIKINIQWRASHESAIRTWIGAKVSGDGEPGDDLFGDEAGQDPGEHHE